MIMRPREKEKCMLGFGEGMGGKNVHLEHTDADGWVML
jgi:hypothetical protein